MSKDKNAIERIEETINSLQNKDFTLYFFVVDSKNVPNGTMQYIYQIAKTLQDKKYKVKMVYQMENEYAKSEVMELKRKEKPIDERRIFHGVGEWMGKEYSKLKHVNISKSKWTVGPADFLFIPEVFSGLMKQTYQFKAPCKRIVIMHNFDHITEFIPFNDEWGTYGIRDVITNTQQQAKLISDIFPYTKTKVLAPCISPCFRKPLKPKKLIVNIVTKKTEDVNKIIKQFYWKYPMYKFITFRDLRGYTKEEFADYLQEGAITIWVDNDTPFGYSAVEAIRSGNIVIGKIPEHLPEWMGDSSGLIDNGVWVYDINTIPDALSQVLGSWMQDKIPQILYDNMDKLNELYTTQEWEENVENMINDYVKNRIHELNEVELTIKAKK